MFILTLLTSPLDYSDEGPQERESEKLRLFIRRYVQSPEHSYDLIILLFFVIILILLYYTDMFIFVVRITYVLPQDLFSFTYGSS